MFEVVFIALFAGVLAYIIISWIKKIAEWNRNNHAPLESVPAQIVKKETHSDTAMVPMGTDGAMMQTDNTSYALTFQTETGEQKKFQVTNKIFKQMLQGESGTLQYQGTRFVGFERNS